MQVPLFLSSEEKRQFLQSIEKQFAGNWGEKWWVIIFSDITGYFRYKYEPDIGRLAVLHEKDNAVGHTNVLVIKDDQRVVGRMPRELADFISPLVYERYTKDIAKE